MGQTNQNVRQTEPSQQPASRSLKLFVILLSVIAAAMIFSTGLFEWVTEMNSGGSREESDLGIAVAFMLIAVVGALAAMGQPRNAVGWVLLFSALFTGMAGLGEGLGYYLLTIRENPDLALIVTWLASIGWVSGLALLLLIFPFIFPDGRLPSRRWRVVFAGVVAYMALVLVIILISPLVSRRYLDPVMLETRLSPLFNLFPLMGFFGVASLVARYRNSGAEVHQQLKWLGLTMGTVFVAFLAVGVIEDNLNVAIPNMIWGLVYLLIPVGLGISILRFRLFDVDTLIRKTAVYSALTTILALVYFGVIIVLQRLLSPITGESTIVVVLSTLAIAVLFLPLRRRVQDFIDRRFYRRKYDAEQVLSRFAATAREETDLDALTAELLRVIQETMEPEHVSLWLKPTADSRPMTAARRYDTRIPKHEDASG